MTIIDVYRLKIEQLDTSLQTDDLVIDLQTLVEPTYYSRILDYEKMAMTTTTKVRNVDITFSTPSRRLLWQAVGLEYIESELLDFIDAIPTGATYMDIGASNGIFAMYAAVSGKRVFCFEPEVANFSLLNLNTYLNRLTSPIQVQNFNIALSNTRGIGNMYIKTFEAGGHMKILDKPVEVGKSEQFVPEYTQSILRYTLDEFIDYTHIPIPNYIKIDVDGNELNVLRGMSQVLQNIELKSVFIELEQHNPDTECLRIFEQHGFVITAIKQVQNYRGLHNVVFVR
ncbi:MAG: hypothetical protein RI985_639 [Chloroflexota bacterium]|jgi:FkbM family methyltransferase